MELSSSHEGGIPIPLNSTFGGAHGHGHLILHHDHPAVPHNGHNIISSAAPQIIPISNNGGPSLTAAASIDDSTHVAYKKMVRYRECLKNHAASMGGTATDGCGEFMPSGEEGSIEALTCSACNCHRNFHRKEIEGEHGSCTGDHCYHINNPHFSRVNGRKVILGHHKSILAPAEALCYPTAAGALIPSRSSAPHHQMIMSYNMGSLPSESDEQEDGGGAMMARPAQLMKKRFRTKFSQEQKEKMLNFAEKVGWKLQKQEETVVQQFCQEIGVKRRVLKVWMHNNKHSLAKMNPSTTTATATTTTTTTS